MKKEYESGRSMVEMLGVLAIVGVLSVGGIAGYTSAMRSYRANEIVNATSMLYMLGIAQNAGSGDAEMVYSTHFGANAVPSGASEITYNADKTITLAITDQAICNQVKNKLGDKVTGDCAASGTSTLSVTLGEVNICQSGIVDIYECDGSLHECCPDNENCERPNCSCSGSGYLGKDGTTCCYSGCEKNLDFNTYTIPSSTCCINGGSLITKSGYTFCCKDGYALSGDTYSIESAVCGCSSEHMAIFSSLGNMNCVSKNQSCAEACDHMACFEATIDESGICQCTSCM